MAVRNYDFIVVGGGIVGLTVCRELVARHPGAKILVVEKEGNSLAHGSGRNSGVIHSGIYYKPGSARARLCVDGARQLRDYVLDNRLWIDQCGKLLLPTSDKSVAAIGTLHQRAEDNGVEALLLDAKQIRDLELRANTEYGVGLFIPFTSVVDPKEVVSSIIDELKGKGVVLSYGEAVSKIDSESQTLVTNQGKYGFSHAYNAGGLFADQLAERSGLSFTYSFLPFKGKYWKVKSSEFTMRRLVYPVPDLSLPFLGVHSVHNRHGEVYFGPSSTPVFGRENYHGFEGLNIDETPRLLASFASKVVKNTNGLRGLALREARLLAKGGVVREICKLVNGVRGRHLERSYTKVGIRSQIFDNESKSLLNDFVVINQGRATHVLNAISPAFTASFAFAKYIVEVSGQ